MSVEFLFFFFQCLNSVITRGILFNRLSKDSRRAMIIGRYIFPVKKNRDNSHTFRSERGSGIKQSKSTPNVLNFLNLLQNRLIEFEKELEHPELFEYIEEFPIIIDPDIYKVIFGEEPKEESWRIDLLFPKLFVAFEADSVAYHDEVFDIKRDRYIRYVIGCNTARGHFGTKNEGYLKERFDSIWNDTLFPAYRRTLASSKSKGRRIKGGNEDLIDSVTVDNSDYIVDQFLSEGSNKLLVDFYNKYLATKEPHYHFEMDSMYLNIKELSKEDKALFENKIDYFEDKLRDFIRYMFDKDLKVIKP